MAYTTIKKPSDYFNTKLYTGNESTRSETGVGFQPDFTWIKVRSRADPHILTDAVRGTSSQLSSDTTGAQQTFSNMITSFDSDGFSLGANVDVNRNSETFASWNWLGANGTASNTDGDVTSTVSVNTTSGFSIVKWDSTGTAGINIGHGLGQKPAMIIAKSTNITVTNWAVYHQSLGATKYLTLNATTASTTSATRWNNSEPTTTTFQTGSSGDIGGSDRTMIAYCFAEKTGYSKFGSYTGNGNADGPFIYTGFKPSFILMKRSDTGNSYDNWYIFDNKRDGFNPNNKKIAPNISDAESSDTGLFDLLSNGFKLRTTNSNNNGSGGNFIYMAFAEEPLVGDNPATAR